MLNEIFRSFGGEIGGEKGSQCRCSIRLSPSPPVFLKTKPLSLKGRGFVFLIKPFALSASRDYYKYRQFLEISLLGGSKWQRLILSFYRRRA